MTSSPARRRARTAVAGLLLGTSLVLSAPSASAQTVDDAAPATLAVHEVTRGATGGPFVFELSGDGSLPGAQGVATTNAEGAPVAVTGLTGTLAPGTYTLRQDVSHLPAEPSGGRWEFSGVDCDGATVEADVPNATATITLAAAADASCVVRNTWVPDEAAPAPEPTAPAADDSASEAAAAPGDDSGVSAQADAAPVPDDVVTPLAIAPLDCSGGTIYQIQRASTGSTSAKLNAVAVSSMGSTVPATQVSIPLPAGGANALGITAGGRGAWALAPQNPGGTGSTLSFTIYSFDVTTEVWTPHTANIDTTGRLPSGVTAQSIRDGGIVAGAIDPLSGNYYWASLSNANVSNTVTIFGWNTTTNQPIGVVANSTWPETNPGSGGTNGDIAFDRVGNVYVVSSVGTNAATGVIQGPLPTTQQTPVPTLTDTRLATYSNPNSNAYNGIAFDNTGSLFIQYSSGNDTVIRKINPSNGAVLATSTVSFSPTGGGIGVDLGACSNPPSLRLQKNIVNRQADTDQFTLSITGGGITQGNTATTSGTANGVQPQSAGPVLGQTGQTYTFTETAAGTTVLANYTTTYQCVDEGANNSVVASGTGKTFNLTLPAPGPTQTGQSIVCTFTNSAPRLAVTKSASPASTTPVVEGQLVTYTLTFNNSGGGQPATVNYTDNLSRVLDDATIVTPPSLATGTGLTVSGISGGAFTVTGTLPTGQTATVTFSVRVNTPDTGDHQLDNFVVPTGQTPPATCLPTNPACTTHPVPALVVSKSAVPASTTPVAEGQLVTYTLTFANTAGKAPATVNYTDNLARVLDDATVVTPPSLATGTGLTVGGISGGAFTVTGAVPAGQTATVTFSVRVNAPDTGDHQLDNFVVPTGQTPPATCLPTNPACTTHPVPAARLTLMKSVINDNGGNADASQWTLNAVGSSRGISGTNGTAAVTNAVVPPGLYNLSETGGPPGYSASAWACSGSAVSTATSVTLAAGDAATCVIVNDDIPARLTLVKDVINDNGGTAPVTAWTLSAQSTTTGISGPTGSGSVTNAPVPPGSYVLSETGPSGYDPSEWVCVGGTQAGNSVALALGQSATCTITNGDIAPRLTLRKDVVNDAGGTAIDTDWTLTATGPTSGVSGAEGDAAITNAAVLAGVYTLSESGPAGYTPSGWVCTGASVSDASSVTLAVGEAATCTITNDDVPAQLTLVKQVLGGSAVAGDFTLTAEQAPPGFPGSIDGNPISGVTGDAAVTNRAVRRGVFALTESGPPGYLESWGCVNGDGATISTTNQVVIPSTDASTAQLSVTCTATNTTTELDVDISGAATNPVGQAHTFTITATRVDTGAPLPGALLDLSVSGVGTITANTCATAPGTDVNGQCAVTVTSDSTGSLLLTVTGFTSEGPNGPTPNQPFVLPEPVTSAKRWISFRVMGESAVNLASHAQHTFTLTGFQDDGTGTSSLPAGSVITYTWSGPTPPSPPTQCTVNDLGACDVVVTAATPGSPDTGTLTVTSIVVNLPDGSGGSTAYTLTPESAAFPGPAPVLTKTWLEFRARAEPSAVNLAGEPHTFTVTAEYAIAPDQWQPVSGGTVDFTWDSTAGALDPSTTTCPALSASGTCTVTVVQAAPTPGTGTLAVTGLTAPVVDIGGVPTTLTEPITTDLDLSAATAEKTWFLVDVTITPPADNLAGEPHTFTVQVTGFDGDGPFPDGTGVPGAAVTATVASSVGGAALTGGTCATGTDANGQCTLVVTNTGSGSIVVQLGQVSATVDGTPFVIELTAGSPGVRADAAFPIQSDKVWWQYRVILSDSSTNPLGVAHTFTATVQRTRDGGATWLPVPDGTTLNGFFTDPFNVTAIAPTSTCPSIGTVGSVCTYVVTSTGPTVGTLRVTGIASTWLDRNRDGDRGAATDPTPDPNELASELVTIPASAFGTVSVLTAQKTWWDFAVDVSGSAENPVGTNHTFTLTARYSDGFGFQPVSPGTTLTYSWNGPAGSAENAGQSTCDPTNGPGTNTSGQCTVVINSPTVPGAGTLTITGIASTTVLQPTRTVSFTFPTPVATTKTWIAYQATIGPSATNLSGTPHTFTVNAQQDRGDGAGFVAVPDGTKLALTLSDPTKLVSETCSSGTTGGTCTVTVTSTGPGEVTVTPGALTVALLDGSGGTTPVTVQPGSPAYATPPGATKTWVAVAVAVTPASATNVLGDPHTFTVTVDIVGANGSSPAPDGSTLAWTFDGPGTLDAAATTCDDTGTSGGACDIVFSNDGTPGSGTLTITSASFTVDGTPFTVDLTVAGPGQATPIPITATKTWVGAGVTISPSASNPAGTDHLFTITVTRTDGAPASGATVDYTWTGTGTATPPDGCTTDTAGTCTVTVSSTTGGTGTLSVTSVTDGTLVFDLPTPVTATKSWFAYRVVFDANVSTNKVGEPHTFTATVQQSNVENPADADWTAVPDGTTLAATTAGTGMIDPASTCLNGGTAAGTCTFVVHDGGPGTLTLTVTSIAATTLDGAPFANIVLTAPATASKTWVSVAVSVTPPNATNLVGETHTFTVTVDVLGADGTATPVPATGARVSWQFTAPDGDVELGTTICDGSCAFPFDTTVAGTGTFTVTSVTVTAKGQDFAVGFTAAEPGQATPPPIVATKLWQDYRVTVTPATATNYVDEPHTFTVLAERDAGDGSGFQPFAGATLDLTSTGVTTDPPIPATCTTGGAGQCAITTTSSVPGTLTLTAAYEATSGSGATQTYDGSAQKTWQPGWTLTIVKASGVSDDATSFSFATTGPAPLDDQSFALTIGASQMYEGLLPGTYTITELTDAANLPPPWRFESVDCTGLQNGASVEITDATATLTLAAPNPGSAITCTYTNEQVNLKVTKSDNGVTAIAGGAPFDYAITVTNTGSIATAAPVTVTDTLTAGMTFAGAPTVPAGVSCDPPAGTTLTCTITASIAAGASVQLVVPVQVASDVAGTVQNRVAIDSTEDPLCPDGVCPPPPDCAPPPVDALILFAIGGGDPSDNQACVSTEVTSVGGETVGPDIPATPDGTGDEGGGLPFTGSSTLPPLVAGACVFAGLSLLGAARRRRRMRSA